MKMALTRYSRSPIALVRYTFVMLLAAFVVCKSSEALATEGIRSDYEADIETISTTSPFLAFSESHAVGVAHDEIAREKVTEDKAREAETRRSGSAGKRRRRDANSPPPNYHPCVALRLCDEPWFAWYAPAFYSTASLLILLVSTTLIMYKV